MQLPCNYIRLQLQPTHDDELLSKVCDDDVHALLAYISQTSLIMAPPVHSAGLVQQIIHSADLCVMSSGDF